MSANQLPFIMLSETLFCVLRNMHSVSPVKTVRKALSTVKSVTKSTLKRFNPI